MMEDKVGIVSPLVAGRVVNGDALCVLAACEPCTIGTFFLDWPYSGMSPVRGKDNGAAGRIYGPWSFLHKLLLLAHRAATPGCHLYVFGDWRGMADTGYFLSVTGWFPTTIISWDKERVGTGGVWRSGWDPIYFASKGPAERRTRKALRNVIRAPAVRGDHPAQKPEKLWSRLCEASITKGTQTLDPFAGSASSRGPVEAAGGVWYGLDIDPRWATGSNAEPKGIGR